MLSDLRESGSDRAGRRPRDVHLPRRLLRPRDSERAGEADLIIAKHRNGGLGDVALTFQNEYPRFMVQRTPRRRRVLTTTTPVPTAAATAAGFLIDEEHPAARALPLPPGAARAPRRARRSLSAVIPPSASGRSRSTGARADRCEHADPHVRARGAAPTCGASTSSSTPARGLWFTGERRHRARRRSRCSSPRRRSTPAAPSRSTRCPRLLAMLRETFEDGSRSRSADLIDRLARSTCCTSTTSAPSRRRDVGARAALHDRQHALRGRALDRAHHQPRRRRRALREQIGERTVSRLEEMCGDPLPLFGTTTGGGRCACPRRRTRRHRRTTWIRSTTD